MTGFKVVKLDYSLDPWRIVNAEGREITFEDEVIYMYGGNERTPVAGYPTKAAAVEALGRLTETLWQRLETQGGAT